MRPAEDQNNHRPMAKTSVKAADLAVIDGEETVDHKSSYSARASGLFQNLSTQHLSRGKSIEADS
jgi:hypothetical protein